MVLVSQIYGLLKGDKDNMQLLLNRFLVIIGFIFIFSMCVPPQDSSGNDFAREKARLDSLRDVRCPRLMSSAAEYYRNRDWKQTIRVYSEITDLSCDEWNAVYAPVSCRNMLIVF